MKFFHLFRFQIGIGLCVLGLLGCNTQNQKNTREAREAYKEQLLVDDQIISNYLRENNIETKRTSSGIYYHTLKEGAGMPAQRGDSVMVHYTGKVLDGKTFDSSLYRDEPFAVRIGTTSLIAGWTELLQLMPKGEKAIFYLPSGLGYQTGGSSQTVVMNGSSYGVETIPPNAILVFEVEMLDILP